MGYIWSQSSVKKRHGVNPLKSCYESERSTFHILYQSQKPKYKCSNTNTLRNLHQLQPSLSLLKTITIKLRNQKGTVNILNWNAVAPNCQSSLTLIDTLIIWYDRWVKLIPWCKFESEVSWKDDHRLLCCNKNELSLINHEKWFNYHSQYWKITCF